MTLSPLKFTRAFEQLKSRLRSTSAGDTRLMELVGFWSQLREYRELPAYQSFLDEFL